MKMSSQPTRRNGGLTTKPHNPLFNINPSPHPSTAFALLPTSLECLLLSIYPATLLLGSLFSLLEPHARVAPYHAHLQSHPASEAPSYFAQKHNIFNTFFVKIGWFWTSLAFFIFLFLHPLPGPPARLVLTPRRLQGLLRWGLVTAWWAAVTQWFFGPALVDRIFRLTGGMCDLAAARTAANIPGMTIKMTDARLIATSAMCKLHGGRWKGGYDASGHVFLLTLASAFLGMEILPTILRKVSLREERMVRARDGRVSPAVRGGVEGTGEEEGRNAVGAPVIVMGLSWWMLLMTAAYFHTWFEKVNHPYPLLTPCIRGSFS